MFAPVNCGTAPQQFKLLSAVKVLNGPTIQFTQNAIC
jgi:hypothetical protein